jgi:WD40 repeat protein
MSINYRALSKRLYSQFPIFGSCIRQRSGQALAKDGSPNAVRFLSEAVKDSQDRKVVAIALEYLRNLRSQDSINAFCRVWAETRHKDLTAILKSRRYIASEPNLRVLSALKIEDSDVVSSGGVEILDSLVVALKDKDTEIARIAAKCITKLKNRDAIDELCKRWADSRNSELEQIIRKGNYIALKPIEVRVLTALKFNQYQLILGDGVEILDSLLKANNDKDAEIVKAAKVGVRKLKNKQTIDALCKKWIESESCDLEEIIRQANYEPTESITKALFYFLLGEWQKYEDLDFDQSLLSKAYYSGNKKVKERIADKAKAAGRIEWVKILTNSRQGFNVEEMTDEDWSSFIDILVTQTDRKEIWRFLYNAPAIWSKKLLDKLLNTTFKWYKQGQEETVKRLLALAMAFDYKDFELIRFTDFPNLKILTGHTDWVDSLAISPDGKILASCSRDKTIRLWSLPDGNHLKTLTGRTNWVDSLAISPDGKILVSASYDQTIRLWSLPNGNHLKTLTGHTASISSLAISPCGQILVSASYDQTIRLWSLSGGNYLKTLTGHTDWVDSLAISPDGQILVYGSYQKICLWSLPDGNYLKTLTDHNNYRVSSVAISRDSKLLVSGSSDRTIRLWSLPSGNHLKTLTDHNNYTVSSVAISPDSKLLVSGSGDNTIGLWSLPDGNHLKTFTGHTDSVYSLAISPDGQILVSGGKDNTIRLWSLPHQYPIGKFTTQNISEIELKSENSDLEEGVRNAFKFTLALIRLRQQFDIDIEEVSSDIQLSPFDIEIEIEG